MKLSSWLLHVACAHICTQHSGAISCFPTLHIAPQGTCQHAARELPQTLSCTAAGKAGGFLALDWNDGSPVGDLARLSYKAHQQLAKELGRDVGYRQVNTLSVKAASLEGEPSAAPTLPPQEVSLPPPPDTLCPKVPSLSFEPVSL